MKRNLQVKTGIFSIGDSNVEIIIIIIVPNKLKEIIVIASGDAFIWVRWLPPYPPTGEIFNYKITSVYSSSFNTYEGMSTVYPQNCEIWPEYHCYIIKGNGIYYGGKTALEVRNVLG